MNGVTVRAAAGAVRGSLESGVAVFEGIPFDVEPAVIPNPVDASRLIWQNHVFSALT